MQTIKSNVNETFFSCDNNADECFLPTLLVYSIVSQFQKRTNAPTRTVQVSTTQPSSKYMYVLFTYWMLFRKYIFLNTFNLDKHVIWLFLLLHVVVKLLIFSIVRVYFDIFSLKLSAFLKASPIKNPGKPRKAAHLTHANLAIFKYANLY